MEMAADNIADATARAALTGKRVELPDDDRRGLELGISPSGVRAPLARQRDHFVRRSREVMTRLPRDAPSGSQERNCGQVSARWGNWSLNTNGQAIRQRLGSADRVGSGWSGCSGH
jgi:hypothetical protein